MLKVASLIEAEAASQKARPLIASVIYNRLADHMMLQFDSTTEYATGNYTRPLTVSQLQSNSPYNTHTHLGLPPTPIDSPGLASIAGGRSPGAHALPVLLRQAVLEPDRVRHQLRAVPEPAGASTGAPHCGK